MKKQQGVNYFDDGEAMYWFKLNSSFESCLGKTDIFNKLTHLNRLTLPWRRSRVKRWLARVDVKTEMKARNDPTAAIHSPGEIRSSLSSAGAEPTGLHGLAPRSGLALALVWSPALVKAWALGPWSIQWWFSAKSCKSTKAQRKKANHHKKNLSSSHFRASSFLIFTRPPFGPIFSDPKFSTKNFFMSCLLQQLTQLVIDFILIVISPVEAARKSWLLLVKERDCI